MRRKLSCACSCLLLLCGCFTSYRSSGRYGDGSAYEGVGDVELYRKFHIRSWNEMRKIGPDFTFEVSNSNVLDIANAIAPDMFNVQADARDVQVDIVTRHASKDEESGLLWQILSLCTVCILPSHYEGKWNCDVEIMAAGQKLTGECRFSWSDRRSILPYGLIPYSNKDGYQENSCKSDFMGEAYRMYSSDAVRKACIKCVAQQLKRHALHLLTTPDVEFEESDRNE